MEIRFKQGTREVGVPHPKTGELMWCNRCIVAVGCPHCLVPVGTPCKGALELRTSRIGKDYTQETHYARRGLYMAFRRNKFEPPAEDELRRWQANWGRFPTEMIKPPWADEELP